MPARRLRSCLPPVMMRRQARAALDPQRAGALRAVELVRRQRQQVDAERPHVDRNLADRLHGVGVEQRAARVRERARAPAIGWIVPISLLACITDTSAVSSRQARLERRPGGRCRSRRPAGASCVQPRRASALSVFEHRLVLDGAGDQVPAARRLERLGGAAQREVVGLGAAAGEHDLGRLGADQRGRRPIAPRRAAALACWPKWWTLDALPKSSTSALRHRLGDRRVDGRRRVVVEIDAHRPDRSIVAFALSLSSKRTRQQNQALSYTGRTCCPADSRR